MNLAANFTKSLLQNNWQNKKIFLLLPLDEYQQGVNGNVYTLIFKGSGSELYEFAQNAGKSLAKQYNKTVSGLRIKPIHASAYDAPMILPIDNQPVCEEFASQQISDLFYY